MNKAPCIFCETMMSLKISNGKYFLAPICMQCKLSITQELGNGWEDTVWWKDMKALYYDERNSTWKAQAMCVSLEENEYTGKLVEQSATNLEGNAIHYQQSVVVSSIVTRLYRTYGYGNRRIHAILTHTYKLDITRRMVAYMLAAIKASGVVPDEDAQFWKEWHQKLKRLEKEYGIATV